MSGAIGFGMVDHARTQARSEASCCKGSASRSIVGASVSSLSVADQQMVEIARAMVHKVKLLVLDEPTAVIAGREVALLFDLLRRLRDSGVSVIFISHRLDEVFAICDRVTVLKDGRLVGTHDVADVTRERLISMMVGRDLGDLFPPRPAAASSGRARAAHREAVAVGDRVRDISIELRAGEIVALAGMVGAGRSELALGLFGAVPISSGAIHVEGQRFTSMSPARAIGLGMGLVTEDRKSQGLAMLLDIAANITGPALVRGHAARSDRPAAGSRRSPRARSSATASPAAAQRPRSRPCPAATSRR